VHISRWSAYAWGAIAATATFIAITCWWLTQDRSVPIYDAGAHLETALNYHNMIAAGNLFGPLKSISVYPIFAHIVGALAMFVGGMNVASPIIGENLIFIPLLALGCYQTGRLLFGKLAGLLAVLFVLGSPLLISLFHVFMLDGPLTAVVAVSIWLVLASEDFSRPSISALAGLAVGIGFNVKSQFAQFLIGLVLIVLIHGGWRNWRGFAIFCIVVIVVGGPWYFVHFSELAYMLEVAGSASVAPPGNAPPLLSVVNFTWYFWSVLNSQVLAPLFILGLAGTAWTINAVVRSRGAQAQRLEFLGGAFLAWLVVTLTDHHDTRYGLPLLPYVAVVATGWIVCVRPSIRAAAITLLTLAVAANTLAITFGVGGEVKLALQEHLPGSEELPDRVVFYSTAGFLASAPRRDGDVPGLLDALHREGVRTVTWSLEQSRGTDFSFEGVGPLVRFAKLTPALTETPQFSRSPSVVTLIHEPVTSTSPPPCTRVSRLKAGTIWITREPPGAGIWVARYDPVARKLALYCPSRRPRYYDIGVGG
jgi:4-amino-4-deoxy-L-arabinose transferase-like glycosyltransferase